jgi:SAM-dependent methyltransferase
VPRRPDVRVGHAAPAPADIGDLTYSPVPMEEHEVLFYKRLVREHRGTSRQVGAGSCQSQTIRFEVMIDVLDSLLGPAPGALSLLDFGCGKGDLASYLARRGRLDMLRYTGIDAIEENVEDARPLGHKFPPMPGPRASRCRDGARSCSSTKWRIR